MCDIRGLLVTGVDYKGFPKGLIMATGEFVWFGIPCGCSRL